MELAQVLHMKGGAGDASYTNNSPWQGKVISLTKFIRDEAITSFYSGTLSRCLTIADLGCSSGPNALIAVYEFIKVVEILCQKLNHTSPVYNVFLNDLPGNDFNSIFKSLESFKENLHDMLKTQVLGLSYFYYGRIFADQSIDFVHSSSSLRWLSKVPIGVDNNKGNIYVASTSPPNVLEAYYKQFQKDFSIFLNCRAEELVEGGRMILTLLGRKSDDPCSKECCYISDLLAMVLNDMIVQGIINEDQLNTFNVPWYIASPSEVKLQVMTEGSFSIDHLEVFEMNWNTLNNANSCCDSEFKITESSECEGYFVAKAMRAILEPLLVSHFGEAIIEEVFNRYQEILSDRMSEEICKVFYVTISLTRKHKIYISGSCFCLRQNGF